MPPAVSNNPSSPQKSGSDSISTVASNTLMADQNSRSTKRDGQQTIRNLNQTSSNTKVVAEETRRQTNENTSINSKR